jgi:hypothetical protein
MTWTRRQTVAGSGAALAALALHGCKADPAPSDGEPGGATEAGGPVALDAARITASLGAVLGDSPWADRARDFARDLQDLLDQLRAEGMVATADTLATGANLLLAPFADIGAAAIAMTDDPTALNATKLAAYRAFADGHDVFLARLAETRAELSAHAGGDTVPAVTDEAVFDELKALETEARVAMSAVDGGAGNSLANAVLRGMQEYRAKLRQERSIDDVTGRFEGGLTAGQVTSVFEMLRDNPDAAPAPPPPDAAEDFLNNVCFGLGFIPVSPAGVSDDLLQYALSILGLSLGANDDEACDLLADGLSAALAILDIVLVFMELAAVFSIGAALPSGAGLLFILFFLLSVWIALKLMCDAIAIVTVLDQCAG